MVSESIVEARIDWNRGVLLVDHAVLRHPHELGQRERNDAVFGIADLRFGERYAGVVTIERAVNDVSVLTDSPSPPKVAPGFRIAVDTFETSSVRPAARFSASSERLRRTGRAKRPRGRSEIERDRRRSKVELATPPAAYSGTVEWFNVNRKCTPSKPAVGDIAIVVWGALRS